MTEMHHNLEIYICDPFKYKIGHSILILIDNKNAWENPTEWIGLCDYIVTGLDKQNFSA